MTCHFSFATVLFSEDGLGDTWILNILFISVFDDFSVKLLDAGRSGSVGVISRRPDVRRASGSSTCRSAFPFFSAVAMTSHSLGRMSSVNIADGMTVWMSTVFVIVRATEECSCVQVALFAEALARAVAIVSVARRAETLASAVAAVSGGARVSNGIHGAIGLFGILRASNGNMPQTSNPFVMCVFVILLSYIPLLIKIWYRTRPFTEFWPPVGTPGV